MAGRTSGGNAFDKRVSAEVLPETAVDCFPRAAHQPKTPDVAKALGVGVGEWYNKECSSIPDTPFFAIPSDRYNLLLDGVLSLGPTAPAERGGPVVALQCKEWEDPLWTKFRQQRVEHMSARHRRTTEEVRRFLSGRPFVHVLVTPNPPHSGSPTPWRLGDSECHEALVTHDDVRRWCPMVAYSAYDARVLQRLS